MRTDVTVAVIAVLGFILSVASSAAIAGYRWGTIRTRLEILENAQRNAATKDQFASLEKTLALSATKEQLASVKEDVAEIKGMFRMSLKSEGTL